MGKELTYREVEELKKKADVYELSLNARYLFICDRDEVSLDLASRFNQGVAKLGIHGCVMVLQQKDAVKIFELGDN